MLNVNDDSITVNPTRRRHEGENILEVYSLGCVSCKRNCWSSSIGLTHHIGQVVWTSGVGLPCNSCGRIILLTRNYTYIFLDSFDAGSTCAKPPYPRTAIAYQGRCAVHLPSSTCLTIRHTRLFVYSFM